MNSDIKLIEFLDETISGDWGAEHKDKKHINAVTCIRGADIDDVNRGNYDNLPTRYIKARDISKTLAEGNLIIEISGGSPTQSTGRVGYIREFDKPIVCSNFCKGVSIKTGYNPKYVYYLLKHIYNSGFFFNYESKTTGIKNLMFEIAFNSIKVPRIEEEIQNKIQELLSSLDAKIEHNLHINREIDAIAKTIYGYWFVQFDFPDKNGKPYKSSGGKMVWNEQLKREIPDLKGWKVGSLEGWIKEDKGGDWGKENSVGNYVKQVNCIRGADINGLNGSEECNPPERFILDKNSHKILNDADIVIEISGGSPTQSTGRLGFVTNGTFARFDHPLICSNFCKAISLKDKNYLFVFVQLWNMLYDNGAFFGYEGKTSGIKNFLYDTFVNSYYTVYPEKSIVEKYNSIVSPLQAKKQANLLENKKLTELRDWLLPMLMNGQVTVQDAANMTHAMAAEPETTYHTKTKKNDRKGAENNI